MLTELLPILLFGIWVFAIVDVAVTDKTLIRNLPKVAWLLVVILTFAIGAVAWFVFGRPARAFSDSAGSGTASYDQTRPTPVRRVRQASRAERAEEEADVRARIAERDRLLAKWAEEERGQATPPPPDGA